jgi:hypothetical protein
MEILKFMTLADYENKIDDILITVGTENKVKSLALQKISLEIRKQSWNTDTKVYAYKIAERADRLAAYAICDKFLKPLELIKDLESF